MLSDADNDVESVVEGPLGLQGNSLVGLSVDVPPLGVAGESPVDVDLLEHLQRNLSGVGSISRERNVLGADVDLASSEFLQVLKQKDGWADQDLDLLGVESCLVEDLRGELLGEGHGSIALPVSADQVLSQS